ncbi:MAG: hypothetical protein LBO71_07125 [Prevotellaceae bacterium]|jgi:hypothetical protein|nr:hypothetical protein [Prevotellaceae bacterium]
MAKNRVCVGAIDLDKSIPVRLMDSTGHYELREECPYSIREIYEVEYEHNPRPLPHSEDTIVLSREKIGEIQQDAILYVLNNLKLKIYTFGIRETFEGKLNCTDSGRLYISEENVPKNSTCFWICDRDLKRDDFHEKIRYCYNDGTKPWGYKIAYVGLDDNPAQLIPKGTLIRLSLAHWWSPEDSTDKKRCYLQLSNWY